MRKRRDYRPLFPSLPHPTRLFRLFNSHGHHLEDFCLPSLTRDTMPSSWFPGQSPRINDSCTSKNMGRLTRPYKSKNLYTPCQPLHLDPPGWMGKDSGWHRWIFTLTLKMPRGSETGSFSRLCSIKGIVLRVISAIDIALWSLKGLVAG